MAKPEIIQDIINIETGVTSLANIELTGTATLPSTTTIGTVTESEIGYLSGVTSAIQTQINTKSPLASPTFTGTPAAPTASVGTNTTQIATTAFVNAEIANDAPLKSPSAGTLVNYIWSGTQTQYDAIGTKDPNTVYIII